MYEIIKSYNETTKLAMKENRIYVLKNILFEETDMYRKLINLRNENIVKIYEVALVENQFYAVQEHIQGETLSKYIEKFGCMTDETVKNITLQICNGLEAIHALGIVHRDINPNNIMIDEQGKAKIIDFGISRIRKNGQVKDTQILGTQGFASPEQYGFTQTDFRSDIYSVGVLMNYLKTGHLPSEQTDDGTYSSVILKCTQMDMHDRYQNIAELVSDISRKKRWSKIIRSIPGFRKDIWWHKLIAMIYYIFSILMIIAPAYPQDRINLKAELMWVVAATLLLLVPVPVLLNAGGWVDKWSFTKNKVKSSRIFVQFFIVGIMDVLALIIISLVDL